MENNKKLQRDTQNKVIGGVCSGLANYFDIDASLVRLLFAIAFFVFSTGFWIYILLWIVMPAGRVEKKGASYVVSPEGTTEASESNTDMVKYKPSKGGLIAGLILIGMGVIGLLHYYVPDVNWRTIWPIVLILFGLFLIVPFNSKKS